MCADNSESAGYFCRRRNSSNPRRQVLLRGSEYSNYISLSLSRPAENGNGEDDESPSITMALDKKKSSAAADQEGTNQLADVGGISYASYLQGRSISFEQD